MNSYKSELEPFDTHLLIRVKGPEAAHTEFSELVSECCDCLRYDNTHNFVFDLQAVEFLASACLGMLVELMREVEPMRGKIALANANPNVALLFQVTKLDNVLGLFDDIEEAVDSFSKQDARF